MILSTTAWIVGNGTRYHSLGVTGLPNRSWIVIFSRAASKILWRRFSSLVRLISTRSKVATRYVGSFTASAIRVSTLPPVTPTLWTISRCSLTNCSSELLRSTYIVPLVTVRSSKPQNTASIFLIATMSLIPFGLVPIISSSQTLPTTPIVAQSTSMALGPTSNFKIRLAL